MSEFPAYRDPGSKENSSEHWTGAECDIDGCEKMAGTAWEKHLCWEHNAERMDGVGDTIKEIRRKIDAGELIPEPDHIVEPNKKVEEEEAETMGMAPEQNHIARLVNVLDPMMGNDSDDYVELSGHDGKQQPAIRVLTSKAAKISSPDIELEFYPLSQLRTDLVGNIFMKTWLYRKNAK